MLDETRDERVWAGGVVRRVGQHQDVLVRADGESLDLAEFGVLQFFFKLLQKIGAPGLIVLEGHSEAFYLLLCLGLQFLLIGFLKQMGLTGGVAE
ncbi:MAG: hypothetical protein A2V86_14720 [Deltaproteobacteria bacterium RBG_16_49_23]|nr:MAG: hypothetical protein A2V86_14720 [Deltaproteobacteria bacterium RBG_16_49_23]